MVVFCQSITETYKMRPDWYNTPLLFQYMLLCIHHCLTRDIIDNTREYLTLPLQHDKTPYCTRKLLESLMHAFKDLPSIAHASDFTCGIQVALKDL